MRGFEGRVAQAAGVANAAEAALVALTAEALREGLWEVWRIHSPEQWLAWKMGVDRATARKIVRLARRASELPTVMRLHAEGRLSLDQATTLARYVPAAYEESACELAVNATVAQIVRATAKYCFDQDRIDRDAKADTERKPRGPRREVTFGTRSTDEWSLRAVLPADEGALIEDVLRDHRDRLHDVARANAKAQAEAQGRPTSGSDADLGVDQPCWADALVGAAKVAATSSANGDAVADRVGVLLHLRQPDDDAGMAGWQAEMHLGPTLPGPLRRYLTCDCDVQIVWNDENATPVQVGRNHRIVPRRIRRLVEQRDRSCRVPGCTKHSNLQIHHIVHWEDDGETVTWNLLTLCGFHHRLHHKGWLGIDGNADATTGPDVVRFTLPTGELISPAPIAQPPGPGQMPLVDPYDGPTGETLYTHWVHFNRAVDGIDPERAQPYARPSPSSSPRP